jgi:hypothetical protein
MVIRAIRPQVEVALPNLSEFLFFRSARGGLYWEINPMSLAEEYRRNADDCRRQAEKSLNPLDKERWLKIAEHWLMMAQESDADPRTRSDR